MFWIALEMIGTGYSIGQKSSDFSRIVFRNWIALYSSPYKIKQSLIWQVMAVVYLYCICNSTSLCYGVYKAEFLEINGKRKGGRSGAGSVARTLTCFRNQRARQRMLEWLGTVL